ncbi:MAG: sodium:proton antiporter NhaD [Gammaproteobacteria bacterium]|nr:sodium:proton antiporter NhaD [Gammaproteobacteria bacterium]MDH5240377.1 sodium:proton antiporter NhaD [Gammaproteobacteria bacterium]MDH5261637.1 sodium:proton antiporter NhaD [Gammaproteobacteria bacterium]MDH5584215.1 sodium:proton antiporter NhaD [Gammaproteobacteria bacterium]
MDLTAHWVGILAIALFVAAYALVITEEYTHLRKSKPVMLAAGIIWALIAFQYANSDQPHAAADAIKEYLGEFAQLFLFLLAAMTYVNAMSERNIFLALRYRLAKRAYSYRTMFWITGVLAFFLSPVIDNLTTALVMCAVVMAVGKESPRFVGLACINIVVAANAGGAFSPFGDITTLMVWQRGIVDFGTFFALFLPSVVNFTVPALIMSYAVPKTVPSAPESSETIGMKRGARIVMFLFACTIATAVSFHNFLHIPPFLGMMTGLAALKFFGFYLRRTHLTSGHDRSSYGQIGDTAPFDSFREVSRVEWDTLLFFFGVIMCVGGLGFIGYLDTISAYIYGELGPTIANIVVGLISAMVDNIPVMVAVLEMHPSMNVQQWLLVTLTAGVGGSLLSIGSAAGIALMGQARGQYTFFTHLKWTPAIALGYGLSIWLHMIINRGLDAIPIPPG